MKYNQQAWEELIRRTDEEHENDAPVTREEFFAHLDRIHVAFQGYVRVDMPLLNKGLEIFKEFGFDRYLGAYVPAIINPSFMVYVPAKDVPDEFVREYVKSKLED